MIQKEEKIIMYDSPEAAHKVNMDLWKASDGRLFVTEESARHFGSTHHKCDCGNLMGIAYTKCKACSFKQRHEAFMKLPFREWDGDEAVCTTDGDKYFFDEDEIIDYMDENEETEIDLLICKPNNYSIVDEDYWSDMMPEDSDGELPKAMQDALNKLNEVIKTLPPQSYSPGKIRTKYTLK